MHFHLTLNWFHFVPASARNSRHTSSVFYSRNFILVFSTFLLVFGVIIDIGLYVAAEPRKGYLISFRYDDEDKVCILYSNFYGSPNQNCISTVKSSCEKSTSAVPVLQNNRGLVQPCQLQCHICQEVEAAVQGTSAEMFAANPPTHTYTQTQYIHWRIICRIISKNKTSQRQLHDNRIAVIKHVYYYYF